LGIALLRARARWMSDASSDFLVEPVVSAAHHRVCGLGNDGSIRWRYFFSVVPLRLFFLVFRFVEKKRKKITKKTLRVLSGTDYYQSRAVNQVPPCPHEKRRR